MANAITYDTLTGKIICVSTLRDWEEPAVDEIRYEDAPTDIAATHYVDIAQGIPEVLPRPVMNLTINGLSISGLPSNCKIYIEDQTYDWNSPTVDLTFNLPGLYKVRIACFPYIDFNGEFNYGT